MPPKNRHRSPPGPPPPPPRAAAAARGCYETTKRRNTKLSSRRVTGCDYRMARRGSKERPCRADWQCVRTQLTHTLRHGNLQSAADLADAVDGALARLRAAG